MRDIIFLLILLGAVPVILFRPYVGILMWAWVSYFSPQAFSWGFARNIPFAMVVAVAAIISIIFSREPKRLPWSPVVVVLIIFNGWMLLTTLHAVYPEPAWVYAEKTFKIQLMTFLTMMVINTRERLNGLIWVITFSVGFWVIKGGVFAVLTGGRFLVHGPEGTYLEGNNAIGLVSVMLVPFFRYLQLEDPRRLVKYGFGVLMIFCAFTTVASYSRGAVLAGIAMSLFLWAKNPKGIIMILGIGLIGAILFQFMPEQWFHRMDTIQTYDKDASAMGRINAWWFAWNFALDHPILGGGFSIVSKELFLLYAPVPEDVHDTHSIYFSVLAHQGFPGLFLWMLVWFLTWRSGIHTMKLSSNVPSLLWAYHLANMIRVSLFGYFVGGAFLNLAYWDIPFHFLAMLVVLERIVCDQRASAGFPGEISVVSFPMIKGRI